ncbi:MAG: DUF424 family protein [Nitrososphaeria archaeon]|nr:DUF424 family protein [Nitrososphaeria archaeon]NIQ33361.1 DUF424 family protein [Nitrososphaeria archaeon]
MSDGKEARESEAEAREDLKFYIQIRRHADRTFLFVFDQDLIESKKSTFYKRKVDLMCLEKQLSVFFDRSDSINLYGRRAIDKAIEAGYVHPEGVSEIKGVPCAIYIKM